MSRKARLAELMALRERKTMAGLARDYTAKADQHARASSTVTTIQSMLKEKTATPGTHTTTADLAASHWLGTALAGQLEKSRQIEAESERSLNLLRDRLAQNAQRQRVLEDRASEHKRKAAEERAEKNEAARPEQRR